LSVLKRIGSRWSQNGHAHPLRLVEQRRMTRDAQEPSPGLDKLEVTGSSPVPPNQTRVAIRKPAWLRGSFMSEGPRMPVPCRPRCRPNAAMSSLGIGSSFSSVGDVLDRGRGRAGSSVGSGRQCRD
jgi:hypothetical protein